MFHFEPYTSIPEAKVLAHSSDATLIIERNTLLSIVDQHRAQVCYLPAASFLLGIRTMKNWENDQLVTFRAPTGEITGFALGRDTELICLLTTAPDKRPDIPTTTKLLATPQGLHRRANSTLDWTTLLWLPPD